MAYATGDKIHVDITATVAAPELSLNLSACTRVFQTGNGRWTHFLYLYSSNNIRPVTEGEDIKRPGTVIRAEFDAEVTGVYEEKEDSTTKVQVILPEGGKGFTHYLYLDSPEITRLPQNEVPGKKEEITVPVKKTYTAGDKFRVVIEGKIDGPVEGYLSVTTGVRDQNDFLHYLYLDSIVARKNNEGKVTAKFDAELRNDATVAGNANGTTRVHEDGGGSVHYLNLDSPCVTLLTEVDGILVPVPAGKKEEEEARFPRFPGAGKISSTDYSIESADVLNRIAELDAVEGGYSIRRTSNVIDGGPLFTTRQFDSERAARAYLDDQDYNPDRFTFEKIRDDSLTQELENLRELNDRGRIAFGPYRWITQGILLHARGYFDDKWARARAVNDLKISDYQLDEWPLSFVDWNNAARELRDAEYTDVMYDGTYFWGSDSETTTP
jgi:hypothetical protein